MPSNAPPTPERRPPPPLPPGASPRGWLVAAMLLAALPLVAAVLALALGAGTALAIGAALLAIGASVLFAVLLAGVAVRRLGRDGAGADKAELLRMLRHDLRSPLGALSAAAGVLEAAPDAETAAEARAIIARQTRALSQLLHGMPDQSRRTVLLVGHRADALATLRADLEREGHTVSTAAGILDALQQLLQQRPDVAVVDTGPAGVTALELARQARAGGYAGRMVALVGNGPECDRALALTAGFDTCLPHPVDGRELQAAVAV
jgi:CheY-like chemotaxis protein